MDGDEDINIIDDLDNSNRTGQELSVLHSPGSSLGSGPDPLQITIKDSEIDENGWSKQEKQRLERGIALFGRCSESLSNYIGSKSVADVEYYLVRFFSDVQPSVQPNSDKKRNRSKKRKVVDPGMPSTSKQSSMNETEGGDDTTHGVKKPKLKQKRLKIKKKTAVESLKENNDLNVSTSSNLVSYGETVIINKKSENSDSDADIDIGGESKNNAAQLVKNEENENDQQEINRRVSDQLMSMDVPLQAVQLDKNSYTDLETWIFQSVISDDKYLNLRNNILEAWTEKNGRYLAKYEVKRAASAPDKEIVEKIHNFLEQIGAINFGCSRVRYPRPLIKVFKDAKCGSALPPTRSRKKKFVNDGEGGCTIQHGANGEIVDTTIVKEERSSKKLKTGKKNTTVLVKCKNLAPEEMFKVKLNLSTLVLMDFHAHSSHTEVMGLIGGLWNGREKTLFISHYEPCKSLAPSITHCDMCPISQSSAVQKINSLGLDLIGWFHSHPFFPPEPSHQDLETQSQLQACIGKDKPCVGLIFSPFRRPVLIPSEYRCMTVGRQDGILVPFKVNVDVLSDCFDSHHLLSDVIRVRNFVVLNSESEDGKFQVNFKKPYLNDPSINYLDKFLSSAKLTLERYIPELECRKIVKIISRVCDE